MFSFSYEAEVWQTLKSVPPILALDQLMVLYFVYINHLSSAWAYTLVRVKVVNYFACRLDDRFSVLEQRSMCM